MCRFRIKEQRIVSDAGEARFSWVPIVLLNFQSAEPRLKPKAVPITVWNGLLMPLQILVGISDADN